MFIVFGICNFDCFSNSADFSSPSHFICKIQEQLVLSLRHECCESAVCTPMKFKASFDTLKIGAAVTSKIHSGGW